MRNLQRKIIRETRCSIRDRDTTQIGWYMEEPLYTISNGEKYGLMYDKKSRCIPSNTPQYDMLFDCIWDYISIIDTEYGACVVACHDGKCKFYYLLGHTEIINEDEAEYQNTFFITYKTAEKIIISQEGTDGNA